ncbi:MFS transporter, partial [Escherichia coli]|uniref:MFS transporter n=1 Tax=Escherichia coli TaxID=562 RepID=UPI001915E470
FAHKLSFISPEMFTLQLSIEFIIVILIGGTFSLHGAVLGAIMGTDQWRLLFAIGVLPAVLVLLVRLWVPESPRWLCRQGRYDDARKSLAWALEVPPSELPLPSAADAGPIVKTSWFDLF